MTTRLVVDRREQLSPQLLRLWFTSDDLSAFADSTDTDRYVKLVFPKPGVEYPHLDMRRLRHEVAAEDLPSVRTYTALFPDVTAGRLAIDFVVHGDTGVAGPWAMAAQPGDEVLVNGPGGGYSPDPTADWHLLVGDEAAIPALTAALLRLQEVAPETPVRVIVLVADAAGRVDLPLTAATEVTWLHRSDLGDGATVLLDAVKALTWLPGRVQAFVHGESEQVMKQVRPFLLKEKALPRADTSISAYWRRGATEEGFREWKAAQTQD